MSTLTAIVADRAGPQLLPLRRFSVDDYHRMIAAGIVGEDDPVELLEGWVVETMPRSPLHDNAIEQASDALRRILPPGYRVRVQSAITTSDSEPEPDLAVVAGPIERHRDHHPGPIDVRLIVEVAESSLERDRQLKAVLYARAGIPIYWILNLINSTVETYDQPAPDGYRRRAVIGKGESAPLVLEGREVAQVAVSDLLP